MLAKFKVFSSTAADSHDHEHPLPSWVIDWRLTARHFRRRDGRDIDPATNIRFQEDNFQIKLENAWDTLVPTEAVGQDLLGDDYSRMRKIIKRTCSVAIPPEHRQFCDDNRISKLPFHKLVVRGAISEKFYVKDQNVWQKDRKDKKMWALKCGGHPMDIVVNPVAFVGPGYSGLSYLEYQRQSTKQYRNGGLWILRHTSDDEFQLIACLSPILNDFVLLYQEWVWDPLEPQQKHSQNVPVRGFHRLFQSRSGRTVVPIL